MFKKYVDAAFTVFPFQNESDPYCVYAYAVMITFNSLLDKSKQTDIRSIAHIRAVIFFADFLKSANLLDQSYLDEYKDNLAIEFYYSQKVC